LNEKPSGFFVKSAGLFLSFGRNKNPRIRSNAQKKQLNKKTVLLLIEWVDFRVFLIPLLRGVRGVFFSTIIYTHPVTS